MTSDTHTKVCQEASYYYNCHKPGDTPEISEMQCHQFPWITCTIYAAAVATVKLSETRTDRKQLNHIQNKTKTPSWERRLETQIDDPRKDIRQVQQAQNGNISNWFQKHICWIKKKVHVHAKHDPNNAYITKILDTPKQNLSLKSQWLRRYKDANERRQQNRFFITNKKTYYHNLKHEQRPDRQDKLLDKQALTAFWASIWGNSHT
jgi:hypothetical protein